MDHNLFISILQKKKKCSQQGKIWVCEQPDETSHLNNIHLHRSQTKETLPPTWFSLQAKAKMKETQQISPYALEDCNSSQRRAGWKSKFCKEGHLTL